VTCAVDPEPEGRPIVRELTLRRRRSRLPWVYLVYRVRAGGAGAARAEARRRRTRRSDAQFCRRRKAGTSNGESNSSAGSADPPPAAVNGTLSSMGARLFTVIDDAKVI
jgi:hypothetical protein